MLNISELIKNAMMSKNEVKLRVYRAIKSEILNFKTAKNASEYNKQAEINLLKKMCKQRKDSIEQYSKANREDLVQNEQVELEIIESLLPSPKSLYEVELEFLSWWRSKKLQNEKFTKKHMGSAIKYLKDKFPYNEGKDISKLVKELIEE